MRPPWRAPRLRGEDAAQARVAQALVALDEAEAALNQALMSIVTLPAPDLRRCLRSAQTDLRMHRTVLTRRADLTWPKS